MKTIVSAACCVALCCLLAFAQSAHKKATPTGAAAPMSDQQFVDFAGQTDMMEANLGQLAELQASAQSGKDYALMLVTDHTSDYTQLRDLATISHH
jgi:putative membrane protein